MSYRVEDRGNAREIRVDGYTCHFCMTTIQHDDVAVKAVWAGKYPRVFHEDCWSDNHAEYDNDAVQESE